MPGTSPLFPVTKSSVTIAGLTSGPDTFNTASVAPARVEFRPAAARSPFVQPRTATDLAGHEPSAEGTARAHLQHEASRLVGALFIRFAEDTDDAAAAGGLIPTHSAICKTKAVAEAVALHVAMTPRLKTAIFLEDAGSTAFVVQSLLTDRRLTIRLDADGHLFEVLRTDEHMQTVRDVLDRLDGSTPKELGEWVTHRA